MRAGPDESMVWYATLLKHNYSSVVLWADNYSFLGNLLNPSYSKSTDSYFFLSNHSYIKNYIIFLLSSIVLWADIFSFIYIIKLDHLFAISNSSMGRR